MRVYKSPEILKNYKLRIVASSYLNGDKRRFLACKSFINSILAQTYSNLELFIVHDGPIEDNDEKVELINSIKDERVKFFETEKRLGKFGYPHRKKYAFLDEDFDFLLFTNDDNHYVPAAFEILLHTIEKLEVDVIYCNMISSHKLWFPLITELECYKIDLGAFIMKKEIMKDLEFDLEGSCMACDGKLADEIRRKTPDKKIAKINNYLYIHN
jgi:hypothetical protein